MEPIRVVWGTGRGPTAVAAYDAALARANIHNYNLIRVSSVIPAGATVEAVGEAPDLGPAGNRLTVVEGSARAAGPDLVSAGLGWATGDGPGLFYEAAGTTDEATVETKIRDGLSAGRSLREWDFETESVQTVSIEAEPGEYAAAVVVGVYGRSKPIL